MPKNSALDFAYIEKQMADNPDDWFSPEESQRRSGEAMRRMCFKPPTMNMKTGQNLQEPFLTESELKRRGYPCDPGFE